MIIIKEVCDECGHELTEHDHRGICRTGYCNDMHRKPTGKGAYGYGANNHVCWEHIPIVDWRGTPIEIGTHVVYTPNSKYGSHPKECRVMKINLGKGTVSLRLVNEARSKYGTRSVNTNSSTTMPIERVTVIA